MKGKRLLVLGVVAALAFAVLPTSASAKAPKAPNELRYATFNSSLNRFNASKSLKTVLGGIFIDAVTLVKDSELLAYQQVISSWEREHLLLNV